MDIKQRAQYQQEIHDCWNMNDMQKVEIERLKKEQLRLAHDVGVLRAALEECEHQTHSMRVWGGKEWSYHPPQAKKIAKVARDALDVPNV